MRVIWTGVVALCLGGLTLVADDNKKSESRGERLTAILAEASAPAREYQKALKDAGDDADKRRQAQQEYIKALTAARAKAAERGERALAIAKEDPKDGTGFDAAVFAYSNLPPASPKRAEALNLIAAHHVANPRIETFVTNLLFRPTKAEAEFLAKVLAENPSNVVKATIEFGTARAGVRSASGWDVPEAEISARKQAIREKLEKIAKTYADVELKSPRGKVADLVQQQVDALKNEKSPVGTVTPEIEGEDLDGVKFKLSDYRGKVVLLDFWGHW